MTAPEAFVRVMAAAGTTVEGPGGHRGPQKGRAWLLAAFRRREATFDYRWAVATTLEVVADQTICPE